MQSYSTEYQFFLSVQLRLIFLFIHCAVLFCRTGKAQGQVRSEGCAHQDRFVPVFSLGFLIPFLPDLQMIGCFSLSSYAYSSPVGLWVAAGGRQTSRWTEVGSVTSWFADDWLLFAFFVCLQFTSGTVGRV